jgi:hypothetical protein
MAIAILPPPGVLFSLERARACVNAGADGRGAGQRANEARGFDKMHSIRSSWICMAMREAQIDALATHLVKGLIDRGLIKPKADAKELVACVVELMSANFETEAQIDEEADKMAEVEARRDTRLDVTRLRNLIRQRLAEKKNFTL